MTLRLSECLWSLRLQPIEIYFRELQMIIILLPHELLEVIRHPPLLAATLM
jgi:hypothetical protein